MNRLVSVLGVAMVMIAVAQSGTRAGEGASGAASLASVEGVVRSVDSRTEDGGGSLTVVRLTADGAEPQEIEILLAPEPVLRQIGFEVAAGDRLKARVFLSGDDALEAHRVLNVSRGTMIRLRTLRRVPLWDGSGRWQGGPCRSAGTSHGTGGVRQRGSGRGRR